jgi:hypothetical protein
LASPSSAFQVTLDSGAGALTIVDNDGNDLNAAVGLIDFNQVVGSVFSATGRVEQAFGAINRSLYVGTNTAGADAVFANSDSLAHTFTVTVDSDTFTAPGPPLGWSLQLDGQANDGAAADVEVTTNEVALQVDPGALLLATVSAPITPAVPPAEQPVSFATTLKGVDATADATTMRITWSFNLGPDDEIHLPDPNLSAEPRIVASVFNAQDRCVFIMNKKAFKVAKLAGVDDKNCVKTVAKTGGDATACVDDPNSPKQLKAEDKLLSDFPNSCSIPPAFGTNVGTCCEGGTNDAGTCVDDLDCPSGTCTAGACISGGAEVAANAVTHDLFGAAVAVGSGDAGKCQLKVLTALNLLHGERWKSLFKCKKASIAGLATEVAFVAACLGPPQPDFGNIPKRQDKLASTIQSLCLNKGVTPLATVFPGTCAAEADPDYASCLGERVACRFCIGAIESDDITAPLDCDLFDDGVSNTSCP